MMTNQNRCWIFPSESPIDKTSLGPYIQKFLGNWKNEDKPRVKAGWEILEGHFLVFKVEEYSATLSGCSIDALHRFVQNLGEELGLNLMSRDIFYQGKQGRVEHSNRIHFKDKILSGEVTEETLVYDTSITHSASLDKFCIPIYTSWHFKAYASVFSGLSKTSTF